MSTRIALILAVVLGLVAVFAARAWILQEERRLEEQERRVAIVVAARNLRKGEPLRMGDLAHDEIPRAFALKGMRPWGEARTFEGRVLLQDLDAGAPVLEALLEPNRNRPGTVETLVPPGKRAITLPVSGEDSHSYMIRPGDYIDIVAFMEVDPKNRPVVIVQADGKTTPLKAPESARGRAETLTETVLLAEAVRVLAVDNFGVDMGTGGPRGGSYRTFTLAMDPENAYRLLDVQNRGGKLRFPLRARGDLSTRHAGPALSIYRSTDIVHTEPKRNSSEFEIE